MLDSIQMNAKISAYASVVTALGMLTIGACTNIPIEYKPVCYIGSLIGFIGAGRARACDRLCEETLQPQRDIERQAKLNTLFQNSQIPDSLSDRRLPPSNNDIYMGW
jgi:hypothetical protein